MNIRVSLLLILALTVFAGIFTASCNDKGDTTEHGRVGTVVTILPQADFVENIGGDRVQITVMVPPGVSPHTYEPFPSQMIAVARADLYAKVGSGIEFEFTWMDKLLDQNKDMLVVDCSKGITLIEMGQTHDHSTSEIESDTHQSDDTGKDPHIWISPKNAIIMVENICNGLIEVDPENKAFYTANKNSYLKDITAIDQFIEENLTAITDGTFMTYHPSFGYLAHDYGLTMLTIEEDGKEPTPAGLAHLIDMARQHNIKVIFIEPQFDPSNAEVIARQIGARVVLIDPLSRDYIGNMRTMVEALVESMEQG